MAAVGGQKPSRNLACTKTKMRLVGSEQETWRARCGRGWTKACMGWPQLRCCQDHALLFPYASPSGKAEGSADFHIIGDRLINPIVGDYIPIIRIPYLKVGGFPSPRTKEFSDCLADF